MDRALLVIVGLLALLATIATICMDIIFAIRITSLRTTSLVSASLEAIAWAIVASFLATAIPSSSPSLFQSWSLRNLEISFGYGLLICVIASAASIANTIYLGNAAYEIDGPVFGESKKSSLIASIAVLAASILCQLVFLTILLITHRRATHSGAQAFHTGDKSRRWPNFRAKTVQYNRTTPPTTGTIVQYGPRLGYGRSLILETPIYPKQHSLETIPAIPIITESVKLDSVELEPWPLILQPSRSCSSVARNPQQATQSPNASNELHIHPLFRSNSPTPRPIATPNTTVVVSPNT
jgi:hypothetical protein